MNFLAGTALIDISPDNAVGMNLAGYDEPRKSKGLHDPLTARCLVLDDGVSKIALVSLDLIGLFYDDSMAIARSVFLNTKIPVTNVLVHANHTHSAPDTLGLWGGSSESYKKKVIENSVKCVSMAAASLKTATAWFASGEVEGKNINRRNLLNGKTDTTLALMQLRDDKGKTIATLINFAAHPVVMGPDNLKISADYIYFLRNKIESDIGGISLFFNRDMGNVNPPAINKDVYDRRGGTFDLARVEGESIALSAEDILASAKQEAVKIKVIEEQLDIPVKNQQILDWVKAGIMRRALINDSIHTKAMIVDLGMAQIVTFPGEPFTGLREKIDPLLHGPTRFYFSLTMDSIGYIIPKEEWNSAYEDEHEEAKSLGSEISDLFLHVYTRMSKQVRH